MSEFSQNGVISTLHDFGTRSTGEIEKDLLKHSKERKMELRIGQILLMNVVFYCMKKILGLLITFL